MNLESQLKQIRSLMRLCNRGLVHLKHTIQTWGIPDSTYSTGGVKFITYEANSQRDVYKPTVGGERRFAGTVYLTFDQTFQIVNEIITNYNWKGNNCD